jgi:HEAT repeat protein
MGLALLLWREYRRQVDQSARQSELSEQLHDRYEIDDASEDPVGSLHSLEVFARRGREAVPRLTAELSAADPENRALALLGLAKIGPAALDAIAPVRERLTDENPKVRAQAIGALRSISNNSEESSRVAAQMFGDSDGEVREAAVSQLLLIGPRATKTVLERLDDDRDVVRRQALRVLREWKQPRPEGSPQWLAEVRAPVRRLLDDPNGAIRIDALTAIAGWGLAEPDEIRELLHHEDSTRVVVALGAVSQLDERAAEFLPDVVELIDRLGLDHIPAPGNHDILSEMDLVLRAFRKMKTAARPAAPRLMQLLAARHDYTRTVICKTLVAIGTDTEDLTRVLTPLLLDEERGVAYEAGRLLVEVNPAAARAQVSKLLPQLGSGTSVNKSVLFALLALGPQAGEAASQVAPLVQNSDRDVSVWARQVLNNISSAKP